MAKIVKDGLKKNKLYYMNDRKLKAADVQIEWTEEDLNEYAKCRDDVVYFVENHMKIINLDDGVVNFDLRQYQKELIELYDCSSKVISLLPRQSGKCSDFSTTINIRNKRTNSVEKITIGEFYGRWKTKELD